MRLIKQSFEVLDRRGLNPQQKIEAAGRLAYKSEDKITQTSSGTFVDKIYTAGHYPVLEFANLHVMVESVDVDDTFVSAEMNKLINPLIDSKFITFQTLGAEKGIKFLLSGTVRAFLEFEGSYYGKDNLILNGLYKFLSDLPSFPFEFDDEDKEQSTAFSFSLVKPSAVMQLPEDIYERHIMCAVKFITNRAVSHELVRHRPCSWIQESQRYCRYDQEKFGSEVTFIIPDAFWKECLNINDPNEPLNIWASMCKKAERAYLKLLTTSSPQAARTILPNSCKTEVICYATIEQWKHIFRLRCASTAEPSMQQLMIPLANEFFSKENMELWE